MKKTLEILDTVSDVSDDIKMIMQIINSRDSIMFGDYAVPAEYVFEYVSKGLERCHTALEAIFDDKEEHEHEGV